MIKPRYSIELGGENFISSHVLVCLSDELGGDNFISSHALVCLSLLYGVRTA